MSMKQLVEVQKEIAKEVLEELEVIDPTCILAGGAPRDWFFGKPATDLDFYIYDARALGQQQWKERLNKTLLDVEILGLVEGKSEEERSDSYDSMKHLRYVFEGIYMGMTIQVMVMNEPTFDCVVDHFCMDNSKVWWKGDKIIPTFAFMVAMATRTLRVCTDHNPQLRYIDKMLKKFPTFRLVKSDELYSHRLSSFRRVAGTLSNCVLVGKWLDLTDKVDRKSVSIPFYFPNSEECYGF